MKTISILLAFFMVAGCKTTGGEDGSDLSSRRQKKKKINKRIAYFNPPPSTGLVSDFMENGPRRDGGSDYALKRLLDPKYYPDGKTIPDRPWDILTYNCHSFSNDAIKHLRQHFYVHVLSYSYAQDDRFEHIDMDYLTDADREEIEKTIPDPRITKFNGSLFSKDTWSEKYKSLSSIATHSGLHSGIIIKMRKWSERGTASDHYGFIEPQTGDLIVDWPVNVGDANNFLQQFSRELDKRTLSGNGLASADYEVYHNSKRVARKLLEHMSAHNGFINIIGEEGVPAFDPFKQVKNGNFCAMATKAAFSWKSPVYWVLYHNNNISRLNDCRGCCANKTQWAAANHDTDDVEYNIDEVYKAWYDKCRKICAANFPR